MITWKILLFTKDLDPALISPHNQPNKKFRIKIKIIFRNILSIIVSGCFN